MPFFLPYALMRLKRQAEEWLMAPFVRAGRRWARKHPLPTEYDIFFFFSIHGLGGAEKVHANIVSCFPDRKLAIFFTRKSGSGAMLPLFQLPNADIRDISAYTDNKWRYWDNFFQRGVCAEYINAQHKAPVVFNGQCNFGYKLFPHLRNSIMRAEVCHNSSPHFLRIILPFVPFMEKRVTISNSLLRDHAAAYDRVGLDPRYKDRLTWINNKIELPEDTGPRTVRPSDRPLRLCYVGRGGAQKRLWILFRIIQLCLEKGLPFTVHLAGDFGSEIPAELRAKVDYRGVLTGESAMSEFYRDMDVLLMTSAYEGFPLVVAEAMANRVVPVVPAVDGNPENVRHGENGFLLHRPEDEDDMVREGLELLKHLSEDRELLRSMSDAAHDHAVVHFNAERFRSAYRDLLLANGPVK